MADLSLTFLLSFILSANVNIAPPDQDFKDTQIEEKLGNQISIDTLEFVDENGETVKLSKYFNEPKPVIMVLVYYGCPGLCGFLLNGVAGGLRSLDWSIGEEFDVVTVSVDPREKFDLAKKKKETYTNEYGRLSGREGWHFLTGDEKRTKQLADELGFGYKYVEDSDEYAHSAGIFVLTPSGLVSRVLFGIDFKEQDLKLALLEASEGKVGTFMDRLLMYCFRYDPGSRGYGLYALNIVRAGGAVTAILLFGYLFLYWRRHWFSRRNRS